MKNGWYAFGILLAACTGAAAKQYVIPPASANPNAQKWEMLCNTARNYRIAMNWGNEMGQQGWEPAFTNSGNIYCLKRPL